MPNARVVLTCPYRVVCATFVFFYSRRNVLFRPRAPPLSLTTYSLSLSSFVHAALPFICHRTLQETGSYAEFSRLLQHTADGNVFKKVNLADRNDPRRFFFCTFLAPLFTNIVCHHCLNMDL